MMGRDDRGYNISADGQRLLTVLEDAAGLGNLGRGGSGTGPNPEGSITIALHRVDRVYLQFRLLRRPGPTQSMFI